MASSGDLRRRRATWLLSLLYATTIAVLVVLGKRTNDGHYLVAILLLLLPASLVAFPAVYGSYALIQEVGGLFVSPTTPNGAESTWLTVANNISIALLLTGAVCLNVYFLHQLSAVVGRRRAAHASTA
jgi:hypothetical protein